jgi:hypothetical protein
MQCPDYEHGYRGDVLAEEGVDEGGVFDCFGCSMPLRYIVDEGTYTGAQYRYLEVQD